VEASRRGGWRHIDDQEVGPIPQRPRNPSGFVRKHPDTAAKRWQGIVKYWDVTEERWRQRAKTFGTSAEAQAWVDAAVMEHRKPPRLSRLLQ